MQYVTNVSHVILLNKIHDAYVLCHIIVNCFQRVGTLARTVPGCAEIEIE